MASLPSVFGKLPIVFLLVLYSWQTATQTINIQARITDAVDEQKLVSLTGNVHPVARPEFDKGPVADAQPLRRMLLILLKTLMRK
jgi:hypothetical protein